MNEKKRRDYLRAMGIDLWLTRPRQVLSAPVVAVASAWETLRAQVDACTRCGLHSSRAGAVFGSGQQQPDLVIVGTAPALVDEQHRQAFAGQNGRLLDAMLRAIGLQREQIFTTYLLKSYPPAGRVPSAAEIAACAPYLQQELALLAPKLIVVVGHLTAQLLLRAPGTLAELRGQEFSYGTQQWPLWITYDPTELLRAPRAKAQAWRDWQQIARRLRQLQTALSA